MRICEEYRELISLAIDNEISPEDMNELRRHLLECDECRLVYNAFRSISDSLSDDCAQPPEGFSQNVMFRLGHERQARRKRPVWRRFAAVAACFVVLAAAVSGIGIDRWKKQADTETAPRDFYAAAGEAPEYSEYEENASLCDITGSDDVPDNGTQYFSPADPGAPDTSELPPPAEEPTCDAPTERAPSDEANYKLEAQLSPEEDMAILMSLTEADIYTGEFSDASFAVPDVSTTNSDALAALAALLSFSELTEEERPDEEPLFTVIGRISEDEEITIPIWLSSGSLIIQLGENGPIYIANGSFTDLLDFIRNA